MSMHLDYLRKFLFFLLLSHNVVHIFSTYVNNLYASCDDSDITSERGLLPFEDDDCSSKDDDRKNIPEYALESLPWDRDPFFKIKDTPKATPIKFEGLDGYFFTVDRTFRLESIYMNGIFYRANIYKKNKEEDLWYGSKCTADANFYESMDEETGRKKIKMGWCTLTVRELSELVPFIMKELLMREYKGPSDGSQVAHKNKS